MTRWWEAFDVELFGGVIKSEASPVNSVSYGPIDLGRLVL